MRKKWTCPYCNRPCTLGKDDITEIRDYEHINDDYGTYSSHTIVTVCPNPECEKQTISLHIFKRNADGSLGEKLFSWNLLPESSAKPYPDYIPQQLRDDYKEACMIKDKSPKASATLSRRCLQGMIRDFWKTKKGRLVDEINQIKDKIAPATWDAIDSVRHMGNIGAHMEQDVNLIIDVDPKEAGLLIWLIETLFEDWYILKHDRAAKMEKIVSAATGKKAVKTAGKTDAAKTPPADLPAKTSLLHGLIPKDDPIVLDYIKKMDELTKSQDSVSACLKLIEDIDMEFKAVVMPSPFAKQFEKFKKHTALIPPDYSQKSKLNSLSPNSTPPPE